MKSVNSAPKGASMYSFAALAARMNCINRWGLMRNNRIETLAEHTVHTAIIAHLLAVIANRLFEADVDEQRLTCCALYHDVGEILIGDLPTPVKYRNETIRAAYKQLEVESEERLLLTLPEELQEAMRPVLDGRDLTEREQKILKAADKFSALIKCMEEEQSGNTEFLEAQRATQAVLEAETLPEVAYFLKEFIPAYRLTLDALLRADSRPQSECVQ